jgi:hypothetical protein
VQRASGIPCSLQFEGHETQTSGVSRRENVDVYLLFEIRIEIPFRHCAQAARRNKTVITHPSIPETVVFNREAAAYWIARSSPRMTAEKNRRTADHDAA